MLNSLLAYLLVAGLSAMLMPLLWGNAPHRKLLLGGFMLVSLVPLGIFCWAGDIQDMFAVVVGHYVLAVLISSPSSLLCGERKSRSRIAWVFVGVCVCGIVSFIAALLLAPLPWLPISDGYARDFVKLQDRQMLARVFQHPLPQAMRITGIRYSPYNFPAPDGPPPVLYRIETDAPVWYAFGKQAGLKENLERSKYGWPEPRNRVQAAMRRFLGNVEYNQLYDQYFENPPLVSYFIERTDKSDRSYASFDTRTSPSLVIYVSTRELYRHESR